jgi:hypothetical protein
MNILILTPDGVGSTILQRLLTMTLYLEKVPVINTHELTNGLVLKNNIIRKDFSLNYTQTLNQILDIIKNCSKKTNLVSRVAKYHLDNRQDSLSEQKIFFSFLNKFYEKKIMCVRENIFEYAMSWSIRHKSNVLNVYERQDREKVMQVSEVDEYYFLKKCQDYVNYQSWVEKYFPTAELISYEKIIKNSDIIIETLTGYKNTFKNTFGTSLSSILRAEYNLSASLSSKKNIQPLSRKQQKSLINYKQISNSMIEQGIIIGQPIKNTTLEDKMKQIKNFNRCLEKFYSFSKNYNWIDQSNATYDFWEEKYIC